jgi:hypothetical protein
MRARAAVVAGCLAASVGTADVTTMVAINDVSAGNDNFGLTPFDCPAGTTALGLGLDDESPSAISLVAIGADSFLYTPVDPGSYAASTRWAGFSRNDGANSHTVAVATICAPGRRNLKVDTLTADPGDVAAARVVCASGRTAVGGGPSFAFDAFLTSSGPVVDDGTPDGARLIDLPTGVAAAPIGWRTTLRNDGSQALDERASAVCDRSVHDVVTVVASETVPENATASNRVLCGEGQVALGGGTDVTDTTHLVITASAPVYDDGTSDGQRLVNRTDGELTPAPIGWFAAARNEDVSAHTLVIGVVCPEPRAALATPVALAALVAARRRRSDPIAIRQP